MRVVAIPGSLRKDSYNRKLLSLAVEILQSHGVEVDHLDLRDFPLPPYDGDIQVEHGLPDECWKLKSRIAAAHAIVIASPEYNWGVPGTFKNVIDWTSRGENQPWKGKVLGMMGASDGPWGTWRMMPHLRLTFAALGAIVIPTQVNLSFAQNAWDEHGKLVHEKLHHQVETLVKNLLHMTELLHAQSLKSE